MKYILSLLMLVGWACTQTDKSAEKDSIVKTWIVKDVEVDSNYTMEGEGMDHLAFTKQHSIGVTMQFRDDSTVIIHHVGPQSGIIDTSTYSLKGALLNIENRTRFYQEAIIIKELTSKSLVLWANDGEKEEWFTLRLEPKKD